VTGHHIGGASGQVFDALGRSLGHVGERTSCGRIA
jgi:hypothetical protein